MIDDYGAEVPQPNSRLASLTEQPLTDDYGEHVFPPSSRLTTWAWAREVKAQRSYYPGVKGVLIVPKDHDTAAEIAAFHENDANCNTCRHLVRIPFKRNSPASVMQGRCGHHPSKPAILFRPDDWMGMRCWQARIPHGEQQ